jgi:hypothetical protein
MIEELQKYMLYENNINNLLKTKDDLNETKQNHKILSSKTSIFYPNYDDTLFWCFYVILKGEFNYESMKKNALVSKQLKIELIQKIRENKTLLKQYKFDTLTNIESNLVNDNNINVKTFLSLCLIENINVLFVSNKSYIELLMNDSDTIYIIYEKQQNNYGKKYGNELSTEKLRDDIKSTLYKIEVCDINKPIKAISGYKVIDLINICKKLEINTINTDTGKQKIKNELYQQILQTLNI